MTGWILEEAHRHSANHRTEIRKSGECGCFYCLESFDSKSIRYWIDDETTAMSPYCDIDSVIGDASGFPVSKDFLSAMHEGWFGKP